LLENSTFAVEELSCSPSAQLYPARKKTTDKQLVGKTPAEERGSKSKRTKVFEVCAVASSDESR
jgi:hypothetical protein